MTLLHFVLASFVREPLLTHFILISVWVSHALYLPHFKIEIIFKRKKSVEISHFITLVKPKMIICESDQLAKIRESLTVSEHSAICVTMTDHPDCQLSIDKLLKGYAETTFVYKIKIETK